MITHLQSAKCFDIISTVERQENETNATLLTHVTRLQKKTSRTSSPCREEVEEVGDVDGTIDVRVAGQSHLSGMVLRSTSRLTLRMMLRESGMEKHQVPGLLTISYSSAVSRRTPNSDCYGMRRCIQAGFSTTHDRHAFAEQYRTS